MRQSTARGWGSSYFPCTLLEHLLLCWGPQYKRCIRKLEWVQERTTKIMKGQDQNKMPWAQVKIQEISFKHRKKCGFVGGFGVLCLILFCFVFFLCFFFLLVFCFVLVWLGFFCEVVEYFSESVESSFFEIVKTQQSQPSAICCGCPCLSRKIELDDLLRYLPSSTFLLEYATQNMSGNSSEPNYLDSQLRCVWAIVSDKTNKNRFCKRVSYMPLHWYWSSEIEKVKAGRVRQGWHLSENWQLHSKKIAANTSDLMKLWKSNYL